MGEAGRGFVLLEWWIIAVLFSEQLFLPLGVSLPFAYGTDFR